MIDLAELESYLGLLVAFAAAVAAIGALYVTVYKPARRHFQRVNSGMDTLLGYPPVLDPGSGRELQSATPPLATRVYDLEETNRKVADALAVIAGNQQALVDLEKKWELQSKQAAARVQYGDRLVEDYNAWRKVTDSWHDEVDDWRARVDARLRPWTHEVLEEDDSVTIVRDNKTKDPSIIEEREE